jgi:PhzF family phenazine biosynthesis protein
MPGTVEDMHRFHQVDVFTDEFLMGNPVAVVHAADDVTSDQMAAMARWTNLSETTFLLTPTDPTADYRLRIFTPTRELPFAGHPTLGSARAWIEGGGVAKHDGELVQQCEAGLVKLRRRGSAWAFAAPALLRSGPVEASDVATIARALQIGVKDIITAQWVDNGPGWVAVLLRDANAVLALEIDSAQLGAFVIGAVGPYPAGSDADFEIRAFMSGGVEDPVTGSLNASVAQWLIGAGLAPTSYTASQGTRLQRRGRINVEKSHGEVWIAGETVLGVTGTVAL